MRYFFILFILFIQIISFGQPTIKVITEEAIEEVTKGEFLFTPKISDIKASLKQAPRSSEKGKQWISMQIPFADGSYHEIEVAEEPVVAQKLYDRYPNNRSYKIRGVQNKYISGRMTLTPNGMSALLFTENGNIFIEPDQGKVHKAYKYDSSIFESFSCGTDHSNIKPPKQSSYRTSISGDERKFIIAIASTGEFSAKHGNNLATINAKIMEYLTLLNAIYERDLAITFELTADNDDIIFFDPATDGLDPTTVSTQLSTANSVMTSEIGEPNYDVGHAFYELDPPPNGYWGAGIAGLGVSCNASLKGMGWSSCGGNYPNSFWMGIFAHEVGHQFGATHTFYGTSSSCSGSQRSEGNGVEPGSGNSLMSYEGTCGASGSCTNQNITPGSSYYYFHGHSIDQVQNHLSVDGDCYTTVSTGNSAPVVTMPADMTIPTETPFYLDATATDPDGDALYTSWEEVDTDNLSLSCPAGAPNDAATSTTAPLFRSFDPSPSGSLRYFPQLSDILDDVQTLGEILPEVGRTIDMRFTARGSSGNGVSGVTYEDITVTVDGNSGPFEITTANTPTGYLASESVDVQWLVNNTNLAPVSCSNVNILFSDDGGQTFPITLASNTPNDGSQTVTMPANGTETGRIKIEAVGNIFFTINKTDISIISDCVTNSSSIINDDDVTADAGDAALDLDLIPGNPQSSLSGTLAASDPTSNLTGYYNDTGGCITFTNTRKHQTFLLEATETDVYTFNVSGAFTVVLNAYQNSYNPASGCQNWIGSNLSFSPLVVTNPYSLSLTQGDIIELVVSGISETNLGAYTVNLSSTGSGELIDADFIPAGFSYKYVIYNSSGFIIDIVDEADLSDASVYSGDVYTIEGLMVLSAANVATYIGQTFASFESALAAGTICGELSSNDVTVTVNGCTPGTKTVSSTLDNGNINSLRYIVENACAEDNIIFSSSLANQSIVLNSEIVLNQNISINGIGASSLSISGDNNSRILNINSGVTVSLSNLMLIDGFAPSNGGAILNNGNLTLENITLTGNYNSTTQKAFTNFGTINISNVVNVTDE